MENVYNKIEKFYLDHAGGSLIVEKPVIEGYLRQKAWNGMKDDELKELWRYIALFLQYGALHYFDDLNGMASQDYVDFILWMEENDRGFSLSKENLEDFFDKMAPFHQYLVKKNLLYDPELLEVAKEAFFSGGELLSPPKEEEDIMIADGFGSAPVSDETALKLNFLLERLLNKIGCYYKNERFSLDFNRAMSLYAGPFNAVPEDDNEDFWLGFWDYFLFDYHLTQSDMIPLKFFYEEKKESLSADEQRVLRDLLSAKFTIFYITRVINPYVVECVNLMTDEIIQLPMPDYGMHDYKKVLLYGHVYAEGIVMLNYITSVQVSMNLRKRIKEEIQSQYKLFLSQQANAPLDEFFSRHAIVVRHIIDILVNLAKVNVGNPFVQQYYKTSAPPDIIEDDEVAVKLREFAAQYRLGLFSTKLLVQMWYDFSSQNTKPLPAPDLMAAAIFMIFSTINGISFIRQKNVLKKIKANEAEVGGICNHVVNLLQLRIFDSRYLTEEGFILSLYAF